MIYAEGSSLNLVGKLFVLLDSMIHKVGIKHVTQIVTNSSSTYVYASELLEKKHPHIFWVYVMHIALEIYLKILVICLYIEPLSRRQERS